MMEGMSEDHDSSEVQNNNPSHDQGTQNSARSRDESVAEVLELEPGLLGDPLLIVGTSVLTDEGTVADIVALDSMASIHVIAVSHGVADSRSVIALAQLIDQVGALPVASLRDLYAAHHEGQTLDEAFRERFGDAVPDEVEQPAWGVVVAAALDAGAHEALRTLDSEAERVQAFAYQEYVDAESGETYVMTNRVF